MKLSADTITDEMIRAIRDAACECQPKPPTESPDEHAAAHDCDVSTYDVCVTALDDNGEEGVLARFHCAAVANDIMEQHGPSSAYYRALAPLIKVKP